jgi:biopolymer transport protein ExbD
MTRDSLLFVCPACGQQYSITPQAVGHRMRCPHCEEVVEVQLSSAGQEMEIQQTREMTPEESQGLVNARIIEPATPSFEVAPPPFATAEVEAPPVMSAPLARPAGPRPPPPSNDTPSEDGDKPQDARVPKRKLVPQESEMDMTPMVDCVFQLLIFFMLTASFAVQKSLLIPKPTVDEGTSTQDPKEDNLEALTVRVDPQGHFFISGGSLEDESEASARVELIMKLKQARAVASGPVPNKLMVLAHGDALHERVVEAIDAANDVGLEEVGLKTVEDEDQ